MLFRWRASRSEAPLKLLNRDCLLSRNKEWGDFHGQFFKTEEDNKVVYKRQLRQYIKSRKKWSGDVRACKRQNN